MIENSNKKEIEIYPILDLPNKWSTWMEKNYDQIVIYLLFFLCVSVMFFALFDFYYIYEQNLFFYQVDVIELPPLEINIEQASLPITSQK